MALNFVLSTMWDLDAFMPQSSSPHARVGLALIIACPAAVAVFWIAIRIAGRGFAEYLALNWPTPRELVYTLTAAAIVVLIEFVVWPFDGHRPSIASGALLISLIGSCIAAPISEEIAFRGFMFRGLAQSFVGPVGAIVLTSVAFAMIHTGYPWLARSWVILYGLVLGYFRWRTNSTWLTVIVHSVVNMLVFLEMGS
jgi:membrane protease YdiL (CAAX protease family)